MAKIDLAWMNLKLNEALSDAHINEEVFSQEKVNSVAESILTSMFYESDNLSDVEIEVKKCKSCGHILPDHYFIGKSENCYIC